MVEPKKAEDYNVSGAYLRGYLAGLRKVVGLQYAELLQDAGLEQYTEKYPPATFETVAKGSNLIKLNQAVMELVGPELTLLMQSNLGREFGRAAATTPEIKAAAASFKSLKGIEQLQRALEVNTRFAQRSMDNPIDLELDPGGKAVNFIFRDCIHCAGHEKSDIPVCPGIATYYKEILFQLTGVRYQVSETRCACVSGGRDCHFQARIP